MLCYILASFHSFNMCYSSRDVKVLFYERYPPSIDIAFAHVLIRCFK